ncbi:hypothetical protein NP233_g10568 [Leucocoprinus birnbaumii]|uniref:Methyltransferase type 11 domain-containing protein n=1 Tax=Leucocoprinus birnbaumii TaxID=56174 RepID=A0AAD5VI82_9AGAR|nr:hypothetical protein NP233_g10568 [Leucocoprinus birnbaumii]
MSIYTPSHQSPPPEDHILSLSSRSPQPAVPKEPNYGLDSLFGLLASFVTAPLYLYATLRGKSRVWDDIIDVLPDEAFRAPALDVGCGRGLVLLKLAQRKKKISEATARTEVGGPEDDKVVNGISPAYGIDIFSTADQTGNSPLATYLNSASLSVTRHTILHTASFTEPFPFAESSFSLVTSNLAIHNAKREGRLVAVREMARVCAPGGKIIIIDLYGYFKDHKTVLEEEMGWKDVDVSMVGFKMLYGTLPCQILTATKPVA